MTDDSPKSVRLEEADRTQAQEHFARAIQEIEALSKLVSRNLGRAGDFVKRDKGFRLQIDLRPAADDALGVGQGAFCAGGHCLYVYDDSQGTCRPCTDADERICQQPSPIPTPHPDVILPE